MQINILESRNQLSQLVRRARAGEEIIIANRGVPVARLVPVAPHEATVKRDVLAWLRCHPLPASVRRSHAEIAKDIRSEREAWD